MSSDSTPCKHFEICNLRGSIERDKEKYCILHATEPKPIQEFTQAVRRHVDSGRSDFRHVRFLDHYRADLRGVEFCGLADFRHAWIPQVLDLSNASLSKGLAVTGRVGSIVLDEATIAELVDIQVSDLRHGLHLTKAYLKQALKLTSDFCSEITLNHATIDGRVEIRTAVLHNNLSAEGAKLRGGLFFETSRGKGAEFRYSELSGQVIIRATFSHVCSFSSALILGVLDLAECQFNNKLLFCGTKFAGEAELNFSDAFISQDLDIIGRYIPPAIIRLDKAIIGGSTHIEGEIGKPRIRIMATDGQPRLGGDVVLINVDLSQCRLVGNTLARFQQMELTNVEWKRKCGRRILVEEVAITDHSQISNLRETYQVLKEKYRQVGNHVTSGDFHYGEMEMRRREKAWPRRVLCVEFLYWALSGYGTRWFQALLVLTALVVGFAYAYISTDPAHFSNDSLQALRFSIQVTTFQRPMTPQGFTEGGRWLQVVQTILGPLQVGLFALALRMRLKR